MEEEEEGELFEKDVVVRRNQYLFSFIHGLQNGHVQFLQSRQDADVLSQVRAEIFWKSRKRRSHFSHSDVAQQGRQHKRSVVKIYEWPVWLIYMNLSTDRESLRANSSRRQLVSQRGQ